MKNARAPFKRLLPLALMLSGLGLMSFSAQAGMQWKWRDANGAVQYSDRPPPAGTPEQAILSRPTPSRAAAARQAEQASAAASAAPAVAVKASDPELEARRKKADDEKAAKQKVEDDKMAKMRADNCQRAQNYQRSLQDGIRIVRTNAKGEREVLDDQGRAEESRRTQEIISANCK
jgi:hypothetical protein